MMGIAFKASSKGFINSIMIATSDPFIALIIGIVATSIIQSSSSTTSLIVVMVAAEAINLESAIPMIMGANIGTTVTNTIVSFGYIGRKIEFERSFGAAIIHDIFNIYATIILFPLELYYKPIYKSACFLEKIFEGIGGFRFISPLEMIVHPVSESVEGIIGNHIILLVVALVCLFYSMSRIVNNMKGIVMEKIEQFLNQFLFKNILISFMFGIFFTAMVQSSSITTSIIIPLVGAGLLTIEQIFPYTLGANIGTTITAMLAALTLSMGKEAAITVAFAHLMFNIFGISIIFPIRRIRNIPIRTAKRIAKFVAISKKNFVIFIILYLFLHFVPIIFAFF